MTWFHLTNRLSPVPFNQMINVILPITHCLRTGEAPLGLNNACPFPCFRAESGQAHGREVTFRFREINNVVAGQLGLRVLLHPSAFLPQKLSRLSDVATVF